MREKVATIYEHLLKSLVCAMKPIIEVQNLSKKYTIGATQPRYLSLRDSLTSTFKGVKNWTNFDKSTPITNEFWALQNIDFEVNAGESIGIIGRNGAGKSTLLKILSRITPPTKGHAILRGRLASLLEVGTGFHPELTGRENVYFNGSILGLRKSEIDARFDEIVDFSGIERFIDTPLKNYSSGMQLRLAFAVAAHLEPEILIIDEVLAVGDAEFQKKCLGKMDDVSKSGRTVIFVSHNVTMLQTLCQRGIVLDKGCITFNGSMTESLNFYHHTLEKKQVISRLPLVIDKHLRLENLNFTFSKSRADIYLEFTFDEKPRIFDACLVIFSLSGVRLAIIDLRSKFSSLAFSENKAVWYIETAAINLVSGRYSVCVYIVTPYAQKTEYDVIYFNIDNASQGTGIVPYANEYRGFWEIEIK